MITTLSRKIFHFRPRIFRAVGDSMQPTIKSGSIIIAKVSDVDIGDVVIEPNKAVVKRVFSKSNGAFHLFGDNHGSSSEQIINSESLLYKVVWPRV